MTATAPPPPLRAKQRSAVRHILATRKAIVHYGMGTGKSRVVVEVWSAVLPKLTVVFAPKAVVQQGHWSREFAKWTSPEQAYACGELWKGSVSSRLKSAQRACDRYTDRPVIVVLGYQTLLSASVVSWLSRVRPDLVVYDECHRLKAPSGKMSRAARKLQPLLPRIVGLTGTLMPHSPLDAWGVTMAISPVFGASFVRFRARYAVMGGWQGKQVLGFQNEAGMGEALSRITIRGTREEMLDLPPATHVEVPVQLGAEGRRIYGQMRDSFVAEVEKGLVTAQNGIVKLLRLRQITSGAMTVDGADLPHVFDTAKEGALVGLLETAMAESVPVVVFATFHAELDVVKRAAETTDGRYAEVSGRAKTADSLEAWREGEVEVLGVQIQAGSEGIDLSRSSIGVFLNPGLSLGTYEQALARLDRPGQRHPVTYYHIVATGTVDVRVYRALSARKDVVAAVVENIKEL